MNCKEKAKKAIENNELISFLEGKGEYRIELQQWVSGYVPTDFGACLTDGIYEICLEDSKKQLQKMFEEALIEMLNLELFDIYCAFMVFYNEINNEGYNTSPFKINLEIMAQKFNIALIKNKEKLEKYFEWNGKGQKEGVWSEIIRLSSFCKEDWNITII